MKYIKYSVYCPVLHGHEDGVFKYDDSITEEQINHDLYDISIDNAGVYEGDYHSVDEEDDEDLYEQETEDYWAEVSYDYEFISKEEYENLKRELSVG